MKPTSLYFPTSKTVRKLVPGIYRLTMKDKSVVVAAVGKTAKGRCWYARIDVVATEEIYPSVATTNWEEVTSAWLLFDKSHIDIVNPKHAI